MGDSSQDGSSLDATTDSAVPDAGPPTSCRNPTLSVLFPSMHSAFDGTHLFQVPVVVNGIDPTAVTWNVSDPSIATFATDPNTGGIMLTLRATGPVTVYAAADGQCGASTLFATQAGAGDLDAGSLRYNNGIVIRYAGDDGGGADASPQQAPCANCHGPAATGPFIDIVQTPYQTAGYGDQELINTFTLGALPDGGYFDPSIVSYQEWTAFHQWQMTSDESQAVLVYLRSLTPSLQGGQGAFGGQYEGGIGDGG